jgi:hypothetical protein
MSNRSMQDAFPNPFANPDRFGNSSHVNFQAKETPHDCLGATTERSGPERR